MYWYNKVTKCRKMDLPEKNMEKLEAAFQSFSEESAKRKKEVAKDKAGASEYESWLLTQRNVIDDLMARLGL